MCMVYQICKSFCSLQFPYSCIAMNRLMIIIVITFLTSVTLASSDNRSTRIKHCTSSKECGKRYCCRDVDGNLVGVKNEGRRVPDYLITEIGFCVTTKSQRNEVCNSNCGCEKGYTCYRPKTGVSSIPTKCYDSKWVKKQQDFWKNCHKNPKCHFLTAAQQRSSYGESGPNRGLFREN